MKFTIETNDLAQISAIIAALQPVPAVDEYAGPDVVPEKEVTPAASPKGRKSKGASTPVSGGDNNAHSDADAGNMVAAPVSETAVEVDEPVAQDAGSSADVKYGIDDIRRALSELNSEQGLAAAKTALDRFGAARVSDLPEGRYAEFIAHCASLRG